MIVSDTNLIAYLWLPNDKTQIAEKIFKKDPTWNAPLLWKSEFRNVACKYIHHKVSTISDALLSMEYAEEHLTGNEFEVESKIVIDLSLNSNCTPYDCEFVALAMDLEIPLITFDKKILAEFPDVAMHPTQFLSR